MKGVGGIVETIVKGVPAGLGSYVHYDRKLDANLAFGVMSVQAIKGVEIGMGFGVSEIPGSKVHDEIEYSDDFHRLTNNAGGIEGGMSNGEPIIVKAAMKPIPTLYNPLRTVNIDDIALFQHVLFAGNAVANNVVDGRAHAFREAAVSQVGRRAAMFDGVIVNPLVDFFGGHARRNALGYHVEHAYVDGCACFDGLDVSGAFQNVARGNLVALS